MAAIASLIRVAEDIGNRSNDSSPESSISSFFSRAVEKQKPSRVVLVVLEEPSDVFRTLGEFDVCESADSQHSKNEQLASKFHI